MAKYKKRKDGRYATTVSTGRIKDNGKEERICLYGKSIRDLDEKVAQARVKAQNGTLVKSSSTVFKEYALTWLETKRGFASATYFGYKNLIKNHISLIEKIPISKVVKSDIQELINELDGHYDLQQRLKVMLNQIFECALDDCIVSRNPCTNVKLPPRNKVQKKRALTELEIDAIKNCKFSLREKAFVEILYSTGIRRGEALGLMKSDINFTRKELSINRSVYFLNNNQPDIKIPKTRNSIRTIPIPDKLVKLLKDYIGTIDGIYLFTRQNGQIMSHNSFIRMWDNIFKLINEQMGGTSSIKATDITPHMFRHNYATMLYYANVDVKQAQKLLGHSDIKTTLEIYTHLMQDESVIDKIQSIVL